MEGIKAFLTRKIGPAPVWLYFVVFVIAIAILLRYRAGKKGTTSGSDPSASPNLTTAPSTLIPFSNETFINKQAPSTSAKTPWPTGTPTPYVVQAGQTWQSIFAAVAQYWGYKGTADQLAQLNGSNVATPPTAGSTVIVPKPPQGSGDSIAAPQRVTSITYPITSVEASLRNAIAGAHGFNGPGWMHKSNPLVIPG